MNIDKFSDPVEKAKIAQLRLQVTEGDDKDITSRQAGEMVKRMVEAYKENLK